MQLVASLFLTSSSQRSPRNALPFVSKRRIMDSPRVCRLFTDSTFPRNGVLSMTLSFSSSSSTSTSSGSGSGSSEDLEFVEAEDFEALQVLFSKYCDKEGLMTKKAVMKIPAIADLMVRCCEL